jgi:hypothetical protein
METPQVYTTSESFQALSYTRVPQSMMYMYGTLELNASKPVICRTLLARKS